MGTDYVLVDTDITFIDGAIGSQSRTVTILSDSLVEGSEFFDIKLTIASGTATLSSPNYMNIEILDAEDYIFRDGFE